MNETIQEHTKRKQDLDQRIKSILTYLGFAMSGVFGLVYLGLLLVMILGFKSTINPSDQWIFVGLGVAVGFMIDLSMWNQGIALAKRVQGSEDIMTRYYKAKNERVSKRTQSASIEVYTIKHVIKTLFSKVLGSGISLFLIVRFVVVGSQDMTMLLLGASNLLMFIGFGLSALVNSYDYYLEQHLHYIEARTKKLNQDQLGSVPVKMEIK